MHLKQETTCKTPWDKQEIEQGVRARETAREFARVNKRAKKGKANKSEMSIRV
jgi:hypothetical protein